MQQNLICPTCSFETSLPPAICPLCGDAMNSAEEPCERSIPLTLSLVDPWFTKDIALQHQ
jgi:predicted amidophosphoribosyltransferase